jgi:hypothetical protein
MRAHGLTLCRRPGVPTCPLRLPFGGATDTAGRDRMSLLKEPHNLLRGGLVAWAEIPEQSDADLPHLML